MTWILEVGVFQEHTIYINLKPDRLSKYSQDEVLIEEMIYALNEGLQWGQISQYRVKHTIIESKNNNLAQSNCLEEEKV